MTFPMHPFRELRHSALSLFLLVALAGIAGCGSDTSPDVMVSPPGWVVVPSGGQHAKSATLTYIANGGSSSCIECHGADLSGGTSNVSCFGNPSSCHHGPVADWVAAPPAAQSHGVAAKNAPGNSGFASCQLCHGTGTDFSGGSLGVSCTNTAGCHGATVSSPHSSQWRTGDTYVHTTTATGNADVCAYCHLNGANSPFAAPSPPAPAGTAPGCFNSTLCHGTATAPHGVPYNDPDHFGVTAATFPAGCAACHDISAPPTKLGTVCQTCHAAASPLAAAGCTSCHGDPPSGATYPNVAGKHAVHGALPGVGVCTPCHNDLDAGSLEHYDRANARPGKDALRVPPGDIAFLGTYNAESGQAAFNPATRTCSNVICHGGQATPDWQTPEADAIDVVNACTSCHISGTTQYNSYFSGRHDLHLNSDRFGGGLSATASCKLCHDAAKVNVTGHFQNLATPGYEQPPRETLLPDVLYNGDTCNPRCHRNETW